MTVFRPPNTTRYRRLLLFPFHAFGLASAYTFFSALLLGLSLNLFVGLRLGTSASNEQRTALYVATLAFLIGSVGFFFVTWNLENARDQWIVEGASRNKQLLLEPIEMRIKRLYIGLVIGIGGCAAGICLIIWKSTPFLHCG